MRDLLIFFLKFVLKTSVCGTIHPAAAYFVRLKPVKCPRTTPLRLGAQISKLWSDPDPKKDQPTTIKRRNGIPSVQYVTKLSKNQPNTEKVTKLYTVRGSVKPGSIASVPDCLTRTLLYLVIPGMILLLFVLRATSSESWDWTSHGNYHKTSNFSYWAEAHYGQLQTNAADI